MDKKDLEKNSLEQDAVKETPVSAEGTEASEEEMSIEAEVSAEEVPVEKTWTTEEKTLAEGTDEKEIQTAENSKEELAGEDRDISSHSAADALFHNTAEQKDDWLPWTMRRPAEERKSDDPVKNSAPVDTEDSLRDGKTQISPVSRPAEPVKEDLAAKPKKKKHRGLYTLIRVAVGVLAIGAISYGLATTILTGIEDFLGFKRTEYTVEIQIDKDDTIEDVAAKLTEHQVIRWQWFFEFMSGREDDLEIRRGMHTFAIGASYSEIWMELAVSEATSVTIIEGMSAVQIAELLEESEVCDADEFLEALETETFQFQFFSEIKEDSLKYYQMEGYLFPETYYFEIDMKPREVLRMFYIETEQIYTTYKEQIEASGMTFEEVLTLASIIEKEAGDGGEMPMISSVFHNRLASPEYPNLQSDYTIFYVENYIKPYIDEPNQAMYDAYNTYVCENLPVGPICNPSETAIKAALEPNETNYLYFVHNVETKECYFAVTLEAHEANMVLAGVE